MQTLISNPWSERLWPLEGKTLKTLTNTEILVMPPYQAP